MAAALARGAASWDVWARSPPLGSDGLYILLIPTSWADPDLPEPPDIHLSALRWGPPRYRPPRARFSPSRWFHVQPRVTVT